MAIEAIGSCQELLESVSSMRSRGLTAEELPLSLSELRAGGFSCLDLALMATARELKNCGFSVSDLRKTGVRQHT